jgi:hypothetical protein
LKFELQIKKILEDFNINPMYQFAPSTGPDQGMTAGDNNNTFPSRQETINIKLGKNTLKRLKKKEKK